MKIVHRDAVLATVFFLAASSSAVAADMALKARPLPPVVECSNDIVRSNNQISVDVVGTKWDYLERDQVGVPIDSEKGWVPGVQLTGTVMGCWLGFQNVYAMARYTYLNGHTITGQVAVRSPAMLTERWSRPVISGSARASMLAQTGCSLLTSERVCSSGTETFPTPMDLSDIMKLISMIMSEPVS
jgi:hypothetical protein